jgi:hypothetical protein
MRARAGQDKTQPAHFPINETLADNHDGTLLEVFACNCVSTQFEHFPLEHTPVELKLRRPLGHSQHMMFPFDILQHRNLEEML